MAGTEEVAGVREEAEGGVCWPREETDAVEEHSADSQAQADVTERGDREGQKGEHGDERETQQCWACDRSGDNHLEDSNMNQFIFDL